jgi:hypothetical protein
MLPIRINQYQGLDYFSENAYDKLLKSLNTRADGLNLSTSTKITTKLSRVLGLSKPISDKVNNSMQTDSRDSEKNIVETIVGEDQEEYSKDIWDYLVDMPYMPSRTDRDKLIKSDDPARVQIWDYFFRIKKEDVGIPQQKEINATRKILKDENLQINKNEISTRVKRIKQLEHDLELLRRQIPTSPSDSIVRQWFTEHLDGIIEDSKIATGLLSHRLIDIGSQNPIPLFGPGELQNPERFPPTFTDINTADDINFDIKKHLTARRAVELPNGIINVLFGVYYFECVLIANDMLATYGLFFDFITGKSHAIKITEQYYRDVVSIAMTTEFRWIEKNRSEKGESRRVYVDDAPTFTISLASGEKLTVTFINEKYFLEIKDKINVLEEDISRIYLIQASRAYADNAIKAIRFQLRLHKTLDNNDD